MNYGEMRSKFLRKLNRRDCSSTQADDFLQDSIRRIQRCERIPAMEKSVQVTLDADTYYTTGALPIPSDYVQMREMTYNGKRVLTKKSLDWVLPEAQNTGEPLHYARQAGGWVLGPTPPSEAATPAVIRINYYAEFPAVIDASDENILIDIANDLIIYGALSYAADDFNDKRGQRWEGRFTQILSDLQDQADRDETSGGATVELAHPYPDDC